MKHAGAATLAVLSPLLDDVRKAAGAALVERKPGTFYRRGSAFLHFHEDAAGTFADLKVAGEWQRMAVDGRSGQTQLLRWLKAQLRG